MAISKIPMQGFSQQGINFRNFVMNGDMEISQRGTSFAAISNAFCIDRFKFNESTSGACTITQDSSTPDGQGFSKSLKIDITTADTSIANNEYSYLTYKFEGQQCQEWLYGTSSAKTLTLSFWCKSAKTGTYCIGLVKESMSGTRYEYLVEYSISSANTWEKKTITITPTAGSTSFITASAAAIDSTTASGFRIHWTFVTGSDYQQATSDKWYQTSGTAIGTSNQVNLFDSTSNDFYLTGVQLEIGTTASDFEHLPPEVNEQRCLRYYYVHDATTAIYAPYTSNDNYNCYWNNFPIPMRAAPTCTETSGLGWSMGNSTRFNWAGSRSSAGNYLPPDYTAESEL